VILAIGEILYDIFPEYKRLGGAPFNFAFHLNNLGIPVCFVSRIGNDTEGRKVMNFLQQHDLKSKKFRSLISCQTLPMIILNSIHQSHRYSMQIPG